MSLQTERFYRSSHRRGPWVAFEVRYRETDLWIRARKDLGKEALEEVIRCRHVLEGYIRRRPEFLRSLEPVEEDPLAPLLVRRMLRAAACAGVGPMAAVAGAIAQSVGEALKPLSPAVIVENGGDCWVDAEEEVRMGVFTGPSSPFKDRVALRFQASRLPLGVCSSSGTVGHSLSLGKADAVTVASKDCALADAAATALGNEARSPSSLGRVLDKASRMEGVEGCLVIVKDRMGAWGDLEMAPL